LTGPEGRRGILFVGQTGNILLGYVKMGLLLQGGTRPASVVSFVRGSRLTLKGIEPPVEKQE